MFNRNIVFAVIGLALLSLVTMGFLAQKAPNALKHARTDTTMTLVDNTANSIAGYYTFYHQGFRESGSDTLDTITHVISVLAQDGNYKPVDTVTTTATYQTVLIQPSWNNTAVYPQKFDGLKFVTSRTTVDTADTWIAGITWVGENK
jgi:hypothetical protein